MDVRTKSFAEALERLAYLTFVEMTALASQLDDRLIDGLENGKAQKFEYTLELCWKAIKYPLKVQEGIDEASPKKVVKACYVAGNLTEEDHLALLTAIDDRNELSHIYDPEEFQSIIKKLPDYAALMQRVLKKVTEISYSQQNVLGDKGWFHDTPA